MKFLFDNVNNFSSQHASSNCRTFTLTNSLHIFNLHESCSYCSNPYHHVRNCLSLGQFSDFSYKQFNTPFSSLEFKSNSNFFFFNLEWSNHFDFSWQAKATGNFAPQCHELHHLEYLQFNNQSSHPSSYNYPPQLSSLEGTLKTYMQIID